MTRKKGNSKLKVAKDNWLPEMIKTAVAILLDDKIKWVKWFKATTQSWAFDDTHDYDKNWSAVYVLTDLNITDCFQSREQFLAYLKKMITEHVGPFGARDKTRFEKARVAYIQQLIAYFEI